MTNIPGHWPVASYGNDENALPAFKNERDYIAQNGGMKSTEAAMNWAIAEIARLTAELQEHKAEQELFDQDLAEKQRLIDRIAELIGDSDLDQTAFELWFDRLTAERDRLLERVAQAKTIILAAGVHVPNDKGWSTGTWHRDAGKWITDE